MNKLFLIICFILTITISLNAGIKILSTKGEVKVRHGVSEEWFAIKAGDNLNLEDAIWVGPKSIALILLDEEKKITIPDLSIVEISDLRYLSKEELLLKLAMERILMVPPQDRNNDLVPPKTTIIHGEKKGDNKYTLPTTIENAKMHLNGARALYENQFFGTFILRVKEVLRIYPSVEGSIEFRLMSANALERTNLYQEALNEYSTIPTDNLQTEKKLAIQQHIERLRKKLKD